MTAIEAEARRHALHWRKRAEELEDAIEEYRLWEPGRRGYGAARRRLMAVWRGEEGEES